ncbi:MAG: hypothetical protein ACK2T5_10555 [Anaerolineales bacterium]|jgi:hypothetical protein
MKPLQKRSQYLEHFRKAIQNQKQYPFGTIAYYGPDDQNVTKIVAAVLPDEQTNPILKKWTGEGVANDPETIAAIGAFFQEQQVQKVVMTEGIIGCPHEEGVDYPLGESCPECPYWQAE